MCALHPSFSRADGTRSISSHSRHLSGGLLSNRLLTRPAEPHQLTTTDVLLLAFFRLQQNQRGHVLLTNEVVIGFEISRNDVLPVRQLLVHMLAQSVKNLVRLLRGSGRGAGHYTPQGGHLIVEANGEVKHVLAALGFGLNERFFHRG